MALAVLQSSMQGLSNLSMRYLNYPAKVLFKSSRVLPTMFFGVVLYGTTLRRLITLPRLPKARTRTPEIFLGPQAVTRVCFSSVPIVGKRHTRREYASVCVLVVGLVIFMIADARKSPDFNPIGVALIATSLVVDAAVSNLQEYIFSMFNTDEEELVFTSYAGGSLVLFLLCMATVSSTSLLWPFGLRTRYFLESAMRTTFLHGS